MRAPRAPPRPAPRRSRARSRYKWHGGVARADGTIVGIPSHADRVLVIDPAARSAREIGGAPVAFGPRFTAHRRPGGRCRVGYKYGGGVLGPDGAVYALPYDAHLVLRVGPDDAVEPLAITADHDDFACHNKWQNGFVGRDGCVYAIPVSAPAVLRVDPATRAVSTVGREVCGAGLEKWEGGVVHDGAMYCVPQAAARVLKLDPGPPRDAPRANRP